MIASLLLNLNHGRDFSVDRHVMGRPLASYPLMALRAARSVERIYLVTDSPEVKSIALQYQSIVIDPPPGEPPSIEALLAHAYKRLGEDRKGETPLELLALLFTHAPAVSGTLIEEGVELMRARPDLDSAVSVSRYDFCAPERSRRETADGLLEPGVVPPPPEGAHWFPDWGLSLLRPRCLEPMAGNRPYPWLGAKTFALKQFGGTPVDHDWQVPAAESWLKKQGVSDLANAPEMQPQLKPQPAAKPDRR